MVARHFAGRAVAVAILAMFLFTLMPTPGVQAQAVSDLSVTQGEAKFYQTNFEGGNKPTQFIDNGTSTITLKVPVYQTRTADTANVPVYWFLYGDNAPNPLRGGCVKVTVKAQSTNGQTTTPGSGLAEIGIDTRDLAPGAYNVSVNVLDKHHGGVASCTTSPAPVQPCAAPPAAPALGCINDLEPSNNRLRAYFIKERFLNLQIASVQWCPTLEAGTECIDSMNTGAPELWNRTNQPNANGEDSDHATHFEVHVRNVGSWAHLTNYGGAHNGTDDGWPYELNVTVAGLGINGKRNLSVHESTINLGGEDSVSPFHRATSLSWPLQHQAGRYLVNVTLDANKELRRAPTDTTADVSTRTADVLYRDYTGNFTAGDLRTDPADPYLYDGSFHIAGRVTFKNIGTANRLNDPNTNPDVRYTIYIDNLSATGGNLRYPAFVKNGSFTPTGHGPDGIQFVDFDFNPTSTVGDNRYIPAGRHTIHAVIDANGGTFELNESNNAFSTDIFITDTSAPALLNPPKLVAGNGGTINSAPQAVFYPTEPFRVYANATDDDAALKVILNLTLESNASVYRTFNLTKPQGVSYYTIRLGDFNFENFTAALARPAKDENWTWRVTARDSSGLNATSAPQKLTLVAWPIHSADADYLLDLPSPYPDARIPWATNEEPTWRLRVEANQTGYWGSPPGASNPPPRNQQNYTGNLALEVTTAKNRTFEFNGTAWTILTTPECLTNTTPTSKGVVEEAVDPSVQCTSGSQAFRDRFQHIFVKDQDGAGPGLWNYSVRVSDVANHTRYVNGTITIVDAPPTIHLVNLSVENVTPGGNFTLLVNASDDDKDIAEVHVNFTRTSSTDGAYVNLTLIEKEGRPGPGLTYYEFKQTFNAGRGETFGLGGVFNATVWVLDNTGNWANATIGRFAVLDEDVPQITEHSITPSTAQVGENVTFRAKARDSTNVTVRLEIFRAAGTSELLMDPIVLREDGTGNFTFVTNFSSEGSYAWRMTAIDSVNRLSTPPTEGNLGVRNNVGPRFDVRSPSVIIDGTRYGAGTPRIDIVVHDVEGVDPASLKLKVAGQSADFTLVPAPGNLNGYLLSHTVPANRKFDHKDVVTVNLTADDNSSETLREHLNFSFVVDDVAPIARISTIAPAYRDQPAHVQNVSLSSRFTLVADDNDGLPTSIDGIRYRILGGGPGAAETIYSGPFKINDAPGVYTGPRLYSIQFWAEDSVGNFNRNFNTTTVYVDDTPPALFQFFPAGRTVNATFVDDRVGVNRSVVWFHLNNEPFTPLPLVEQDGAWTLTLPEGVKGDTYSFYLQAWDRLDNSETFGNATNPYVGPISIANHEPKLRITAPVDGGRIFRTVDLTWEASDEDNDALVFTVYYKGPGRATFVELAKIENSATRRYTIDTTRFQDGQYTFRLAAGDGGFVKLAETTVTVLNRATAVGVVSVSGSALPGESMIIKAEVTKSEATVEARLYLAGALVNSYPMNDLGKDGDELANDGFYSVRVPIDAAGDYSVEIFTEYREDGELKQFSSQRGETTFSAKLTPGYLLGTYGAIIGLIGLLAAVGIGVAVFVVMRRR